MTHIADPKLIRSERLGLDSDLNHVYLYLNFSSESDLNKKISQNLFQIRFKSE